MTTTTTPADHRTSDVAADPAPAAGRRVPFAVVVAGSMLSGLVNTLLLVLVVFAGATEPVITGAGLVGLASGWALLAMLTTRWTSQPQRWAAVPAAVMATTGVALLAVTPGNGTLTAAGWVWPPAALVLAVWMARAARRATTGRSALVAVPGHRPGGRHRRRRRSGDRHTRPRPRSLRDDRGAVRRGRTPPAPDLHRHRQPHRRPRERPGRDLAAVERHHHAGLPHHPGLRLRPGRSGLERRRRPPAGRGRRRHRPAHPAVPRRRARPLRPGRPLLRRHARPDLRRPLPGAGRRDGAARLVQPAPVHRPARLRRHLRDDAPAAAGVPGPGSGRRAAPHPAVDRDRPLAGGGRGGPGVRDQPPGRQQHARRAGPAARRCSPRRRR